MQDNVPPDSSADRQVENRPLARPRRSGWWRTFRDSNGAYIAVALGSIVGAVARFLVSVLSVSQFGDGFPWGTLFVNVTGSFAIGFYAALTGPDGRLFVSPRQRQFVMVGICGGYTTFSSFSLETLRLVQSGNARTALVYLLVSAVTWLVGVWLGHALAARLNRL
ncbi:MAG: fluoride efflux transporter CrcB [Bradyrhizobium sp.]|uniref:fluoride efflux transporter CrcB n=1 Tax=Bradyrhizobium sp. TaxID=376 RepID=UPI001EBE86A6|nr:fluoride efflux transporter CrcB [Bradyrhizobium sp.]MBU6458969.1 fluoride efflux transporter CrcB [Bradyrhizobium sp.]MDE2332427.1 fluoride efflux transporter CrcB [Bradyrhizobium sp.]MDE2603703.1 fluoride efflux transporter CrcB [Bradyrhizobium sp.]